jgi:DNA-binding CsgD family transcriptional regulator
MMSPQVSTAPVKPSGSVLWIAPWERNALQLLADGLTTNELSRRLGFRASEIESRLARLFAAMGAETHTEAILIAHKRGLLTPAASPSCHGPVSLPDKAAATQRIAAKPTGQSSASHEKQL